MTKKELLEAIKDMIQRPENNRAKGIVVYVTDKTYVALQEIKKEVKLLKKKSNGN